MPGLIINGVQMEPNLQREVPDDVYLSTVRWLTVPFNQRTSAAWTNNNVAQIKALEDPVRREIYDAMRSSATEAFNFPTQARAEDHFSMRIDIIFYMNQMNSTNISYRYTSNADPDNGIASHPVKEPGDRWQKGDVTLFFFKASNRYSSSAALDQLKDRNFVTYGECRGAIHACVLLAVRDIMQARSGSDDAFNGVQPPGSLELKKEIRWTYIAPDQTLVIPGDLRYMKNFPDYLTKAKARGQPNAQWQGENTVYVGKKGGTPTYAGLGAAADSEAALRQRILDAYNADTGSAVRDASGINWGTLERPTMPRPQ